MMSVPNLVHERTGHRAQGARCVVAFGTVASVGHLTQHGQRDVAVGEQRAAVTAENHVAGARPVRGRLMGVM
jgi:hypothetical protein